MTLKNNSKPVKLIFKWDSYNTSLAIKKLLRHVERGEIKFHYNANKGSLASELIAKIIDWNVGTLFMAGEVAVIYYFWNRIRKIKKRKRIRKEGIDYTVRVTYNNEEYTLTGEESDAFVKKFEIPINLVQSEEKYGIEYKNKK